MLVSQRPCEGPPTQFEFWKSELKLLQIRFCESVSNTPGKLMIEARRVVLRQRQMPSQQYIYIYIHICIDIYDNIYIYNIMVIMTIMTLQWLII